MKRILFLISFFYLSNLVYSQTETFCGILPKKNFKVCYEEVVIVNNLKASLLYNNTKIWISRTFASSKAVIESDIENTSLVIKGFLKENEYSKYGFNLTIQFKDGRFKYTLTDIHYFFHIDGVADINKEFESAQSIIDCNTTALKEEDKKFKRFIDDLKSSINVKNDW